MINHLEFEQHGYIAAVLFPDGNSIGHHTQTVIGGRRSGVRRFTYLMWAGDMLGVWRGV
jgi:hypothetical protein